jgi:hypothetical protein
VGTSDNEGKKFLVGMVMDCNSGIQLGQYACSLCILA